MAEETLTDGLIEADVETTETEAPSIPEGFDDTLYDVETPVSYTHLTLPTKA